MLRRKAATCRSRRWPSVRSWADSSPPRFRPNTSSWKTDSPPTHAPRPMKIFSKFIPLGVTLLALGLSNRLPAADNLTKVRMSFDEDMIVTQLADSLGYFKQEGIEIVPVDIMKLAKEDYLLQEPLVKGQIDAAEHWFNHTIFG